MQHYNFWILSTTNEMEETLTRPGRHWDAYFSALYLAKGKKPTQGTMQVTALCAVIQWYIPMSMILLQHGIIHHWWSFCLNAEEKLVWWPRWFRAMYCLCSTAHIACVGTTPISDDTWNSNSKSCSTYLLSFDPDCTHTHRKSQREEVCVFTAHTCSAKLYH